MSVRGATLIASGRERPTARLHSRLGLMVGLRMAALGIALLVLLPSGSGSAAAAELAAEEPPTLLDARIVGDAQRTLFVADLTRPVEFAVSLMADPYRLVIDLPQIKFSLPDGIGERGWGMISAFRYGQISPGKSRVVLDVTQPVEVDKSFVTPPAAGQPPRLAIHVVPTTRERFLEEQRRSREEKKLEAEKNRNRSLVPRLPGREEGLTLVIDAGHGGIDTGAIGRTGVLEKDITLAFARLLGAKLERTGLYNIHYTREDDRFVALGERVEIARSLAADLFISIHANSFPKQNVRGTVIYTADDAASDRMAAEIAASENQADVLAGLDLDQTETDGVRDILFDLTRRETRNFGVVFARNLVKDLGSVTRMFKIPHQKANFEVLEAPDVPSAMVELGFLSNPEDEALLLSGEWRDRTADSIVRAIEGFFDAKEHQNIGR